MFRLRGAGSARRACSLSRERPEPRFSRRIWLVGGVGATGRETSCIQINQKRGRFMSSSTLKPAAELARGNSVRFPNESADYRRAREHLLAEEIELRRHIERVAELRRALPPGGAVTKNYAFEGEGGKATLPDLFGDKQTLVIYSYMFGPARQQLCPMCTSFMATWEEKLPDIEQRIAFVFVARSPIARLIEAKRARG